MKLLDLRVSRKFVDFLKEIYRDVKACVKTAPDRVSGIFQCFQGLRQGDSLSCICFILYLNDLADYLYTSGAEDIIIGNLYLTILLFADDLCIFDVSPRGLQRKIDMLVCYCKKWCFQINVEKTKVM